jgi:hypothetical protein
MMMMLSMISVSSWHPTTMSLITVPVGWWADFAAAVAAGDYNDEFVMMEDVHRALNFWHCWNDWVVWIGTRTSHGVVVGVGGCDDHSHAVESVEVKTTY